MREILFRGKTAKQNNGVTTENPIKENMWVYGNLTVGKLENYHIDMISNKKEIYTIKSETIGQFTGLTDKNGKKIFEGDIVKAIISINDYSRDKVRNEEGIYEIKYHTKHCYFYLAKEGNNLLFDGNWRYYLKEIKVIGNIHDNKELLGE